MAPLTPPQVPLTWRRTAQDVDKLITEALEKKKKVNDHIVSLAEDKRGFDNVSIVWSFPHTDGQPLRSRCL